MTAIEDSGIEIALVGHSLSYLLPSSSLFYGTGYKVLYNQKQDHFVRCFKYKHNGKPKLTYMLQGCISLSSCISELPPEASQTLLISLLEAILDVKDNGFLSIGNIDLAPDRIFVNPESFQARIIYLPLAVPDNTSLSDDVQIAICKLVKELTQRQSGSEPSSPHIPKLLEKIVDNSEALLETLKNDENEAITTIYSIEADSNELIDTQERLVPPEAASFILESQPPYGNVAFRVFKNKTIVGKSASKADCLINLSPTISRVHCQLRIDGDDLWVTDLNSANGTYVNGAKISPGCETKLEIGSRLLLANVEFLVSRAR